MEASHVMYNIAGTPQGSIISPILANIFMSQLDALMEEIKEEFNKGTKARLSAGAQRIHYQLHRAKSRGDMKEVARLAKQYQGVTSANFEDENFKRVVYVRYADD